jgi:hypothetical protein
MVVWGLSVFDAVGSVFTSRRAAVASSLQNQDSGQGVSITYMGPVRATSEQVAKVAPQIAIQQKR